NGDNGYIAMQVSGLEVLPGGGLTDSGRMHDYALVYKKSDDSELNLIEDLEGQFKLFDEFGGFELRELRNRNVKFNKDNRSNLYYPFYIDLSSEDENGLYDISLDKKEGFFELFPKPSQGVDVVWRWGKEKSKNNINININIKAKPMRDGGYMIVEKYRESRAMARSVWWDKETNTEKGTLVVKELLEGKFFDYPKPVEMISRFLEMATNLSQDDIILDFFAGSGTVAHSVMEINLKDGGNRQSISVQLPEKLEENSEAYKAGYRTIADITRARIEKVIAKLKAEHPEKTEGLACANFTLAPSNFKVWNSDISDPGAIRQQLDALQNTEKAHDEQIAMLTELLLKNGLGALGVHAISKPRKLACGVTVHRVLREDDRYLWLCFEPYVDAVRDEILNANPAQVIMLNSCFTGTQGDEQLSNLQLELAAQDISLLVI
ncbi:DNA methyltransferase, partial [Vreelandella aquamarina]|uniref:DNA methyltransferase n=1 Tax=Vreelandella aquamarina TaxID=77097 RepID=UPI00224C5DE1